MSRRLVIGIAAGLVFASLGPLLADVGSESGRHLEAPPGSNHVRSDIRQAFRGSAELGIGTGWMDVFISAWTHEQQILADQRPYSDRLAGGRVTLSRRTCFGQHGCFDDRWTGNILDHSSFVVDPPSGLVRLSSRLESERGAECTLDVTGFHEPVLQVGHTFNIPYQSVDTLEVRNRVWINATGSCIGGTTTVATGGGDIWKRTESTPSVLPRPGPGTIETIAGVPDPGFEGDGGPARWAWLGYPSDVAIHDGRIYIVEPPNNVIRRIDPDGTIHSHVRVGADSIAFLPDGSLVATDGWRHVYRIAADGSPVMLAGNGTELGDGGNAVDAEMSRPQGIATDARGTIYVADSGHNRVRAIGPDGVIQTVAGNGSCSDPLDGVVATQSAVCSPTDVAAGPDGSIIIVESDQKRVRRVSPDGRINTVVRPTGASVAPPYPAGTVSPDLIPEDAGIAADGTVFISFGNVIARLTETGQLEPIAGTHWGNYAGDGGPALAAGLAGATGIVFDSYGRLIFADRWHHAIRRINGNITAAEAS